MRKARGESFGRTDGANHSYLGQRLFINFLKYGVLTGGILVVLAPLLVIVFTAFKTDAEYTTTSVWQLPASFGNFTNYYKAFTQGNFILAFGNSFLIVVIGVAGNILFGTMTAYCLNRFDFKLKKMITGIYFLSAIVPTMCLQVSIYSMLKSLGVINTYWAPVLLYTTTDIVMIWIYLQFLEKVPKSLDESAMLDGASYFQIFQAVILPLLTPATATVAILKAITIYNDLFTQVLYMTKQELRTVTTALIIFQGDRINAQNLMSAGIVLVMFPTVLLFLGLQKYIFSGITAGAIKE